MCPSGRGEVRFHDHRRPEPAATGHGPGPNGVFGWSAILPVLLLSLMQWCGIINVNRNRIAESLFTAGRTFPESPCQTKLLFTVRRMPTWIQKQ
jgi:hypothetical protein